MEGVSKGTHLDFVVIGIGLNVNSSLERIGEEGATSLKVALGKGDRYWQIVRCLVAESG